VTKKKKQFIPLSDDLEKLALSAVIRGLVPETELHEEELSKLGKVVLQAVKRLRSYDATPDDIPATSVQTAASEILGADHREVGMFINSCIALTAGKEAGDLLKTVRQKTLLVEAINEAGNQLVTGALDLEKVAATLEDESCSTLESASDMLADGLPEEPKGPPIRSLPLLTEASGGIIGMWAVASEAGVGKSTLAVQVAVDYGRFGPVLYYDMENGPQVMLYRVGKRFKGDIEIARKATRRIYFRESIKTLNEDLRALKGQKCLIVVDSLQKLPASVEHRRGHLDAWVHRFERLKKKGHMILLISEKSREEYGAATLRGFKETGEIEYSADFGFHLVPDKTCPMISNVVIVKNRHRPIVGKICALERVNGFRFVERTA
jgi:hypothetical protein